MNCFKESLVTVNKITSEKYVATFVCLDDEMDDKKIKEGVPDPLKLEDLLDSQEGTEVDNDEQDNKNIPSATEDSNMEGELPEKVDNEDQQNKNLPSATADSNMEGELPEKVDNEDRQNKNLPSDGADAEKLCDTDKEQSSTKTCGGCTI